MTATAEKQKLSPAPDIGDLLFALIIAIPLMGRPTFLFQDGSTGWHLVTGEYILKNHAIPHEDIMCYLDKIPGKADKAWVAYEWLSDTIMAGLVQLGGLNLLAVVCSCAIGLMFLMLYDRCRKEGCHFLIVLLASIFGIIASAVHWLARPHLFTFFGVLLFSGALEDYYRRTISSTKLFLILSLYMLIWVNCHPAFIVGFVLIGIYLVASLCSAAFYGPGTKRKSYLETAKTLTMALAATFAASLVNPNGLVLYQYIEKYLKGSTVLANTEEFMSPVFHFTIHPTCLEALFALFIVGLAISLNRLSFPRLLLCLAFSHLALSAVRNIPLFTIIILPAIAQLYAKVRLAESYRLPQIVTADDASQIEGTPANLAALSRAEAVDFRPESLESESSPSTIWQQIADRFEKIGTEFDETERQCKMHLLPILLFVGLSITAMMGGKIAGIPILESGFDPEDKPTKTLEYLQKAEAEGQLKYNQGFNLDNWGGYIKYKLGTPVFIDDRADFYGEGYYSQYAIINQVLTFPDGKPGWKEWLAKDNIQWVLVPKDSRLAQALKTTDGWKVAAEDPASVLIVHDKPYAEMKDGAIQTPADRF